MPYRAIALQALERWREAHCRLEDFPPGSPEWHVALADEVLAMADYKRAVEDATLAHAPVPPSFKEASESPVES